MSTHFLESTTECWVAVFSDNTFIEFKMFCQENKNNLHLGGKKVKVGSKKFTLGALIFFYITGKKHFIGYCQTASTKFESNAKIKIYNDEIYNEMVLPICELHIFSDPFAKLTAIFEEDPNCFKPYNETIGGSAFGLAIKSSPFANVSDSPNFCNILKRKARDCLANMYDNSPMKASTAVQDTKFIVTAAPTLDSNFNLDVLKEDKWRSLHINIENLQFIIQALIQIKQIIFVGDFGTSKTFSALQIIRLLTDSQSQYKVVQFYDSYSYEEFVEGIKPSTEMKYAIQPGPLLQLVSEAQKEENRSKNYFLLIDEMNRGNTVSIFGELLHALDRDYSHVLLKHSGAQLKLPDNFFIIGTMNDKDRNLCHIDMAVFRRFASINLEEMKIFEHWLQDKHTTEKLSDKVLLLLKLKDKLKSSLKLHHEPFPMGIFFAANLKDENSISFLWQAKAKPFLDRNCLPEKLEDWKTWEAAKKTLQNNEDVDKSLQSPAKRLKTN